MKAVKWKMRFYLTGFHKFHRDESIASFFCQTQVICFFIIIVTNVFLCALLICSKRGSREDELHKHRTWIC